jgi:hypothetical protein
MVYLSGRKGMLVARLDATELEARASKGPAETTSVSSAGRSVVLLGTPHSAAATLPVCGLTRRLGRKVEGSVVDAVSR